MQPIKRILNFYKKPADERIRIIKQIIAMLKLKVRMFSALPFLFGKANFPFTFIAYQPDSYSHAKSHDEFLKLFSSFIKNNKFNNSGDVTRLWSFILNIKQLLNENIPGDFAELGVWRGNTASVLAHYAALSDRKVYLFDTFSGFDVRDLKGVDLNKDMGFSDTSLSLVGSIMGDAIDACEFVPGYFPTTITEKHKDSSFSIVHLDCDLYEPMKAGLEFFYPRMPKGGLFLLHDYSSNFWDGAKKAIDEFCLDHNEFIILLPDKSGSALLRKSK